MTHPLWPLYDLRVATPRLELRLPNEDELAELAAVARAGVHDADAMPFEVPWTTLPSPAFEWGFVRFHWRLRGTWEPARWGLELGVFVDGRPVGSQGLYADDFALLRTVRSGSWLARDRQGRGLGKEMRIAILALAFDGLGAELAETSAFADNVASIGVSRALGYEQNGVGRFASQGRVRDMIRFRMTRDHWLRARAERAYPQVGIEGLAPSLPLFGIG